MISFGKTLKETIGCSFLQIRANLHSLYMNLRDKIEEVWFVWRRNQGWQILYDLSV
jgi:hypothetical protein